MKNLPFVLSGVLFVAVAVLYYLHFSSSDEGNTPKVTSSLAEPGDLQIAYVDWDSLQADYEFLKERIKDLEGKEKVAMDEYQSRAENFQKIRDKHIQNAKTYTLFEQQAAEKELTEKQQNLMMYEQRASQALAAEQNSLGIEFNDRVREFVTEYSAAHDIQLVLRKNALSDLLYAPDLMDITDAIIEGLNKKYLAEKEGKSGKNNPDSTTNK